MSLEAEMVTRFSAAVDDRLWWNTLPEGTSPEERADPFVILQRIGGPRRQYVDDSEQPTHLQSRIQVEVWGERVLEVSDAMTALIDLMLASNTADWGVRVEGEPMADSNTTLGLHGLRVDIIVTHRR